MTPILSVRNIRKVFSGKSKERVIVDDLSFDLYPGEILGLLGSNGAGKTTTIQMLLSTLKPTSGSIVYFGRDFAKHRSEILQKVAFASTYVSLPWALTVGENVEVFARLYGVSSKEIHPRMDALLERFGILNKKTHCVSELSHGQITRLMLVKAFVVHPKVVLLDEPTASLDPDIAQDVCQFILEQRSRDQTSILFTSHNMAEVSDVCDRVLFLQKGKVVANNLPSVLARSISSSRLRLAIADGMHRTIAIAEQFAMPFYHPDSTNIEARAGLRMLGGVVQSTFESEQVVSRGHQLIELKMDEPQIAPFLNALASAGVVYTQIRIIQPSLEDYFIKMASPALGKET